MHLSCPVVKRVRDEGDELEELRAWKRQHTEEVGRGHVATSSLLCAFL